MSYVEAKDVLNDNSRNYVNAEDDPYNWNINTALFTLTEALESDMGQVDSRLARIETVLTEIASR